MGSDKGGIALALRAPAANPKDAYACARIVDESHSIVAPWKAMFPNEAKYRNSITKLRAEKILENLKKSESPIAFVNLSSPPPSSNTTSIALDSTRSLLATRTDTGEDVSMIRWTVKQLSDDEPPSKEAQDSLKVCQSYYEQVGGTFDEEVFLNIYDTLASMHYDDWKGKGPHVKLTFTGTIPQHQGLGAGSLLLSRVLEEVDSTLGLPVYLEASDQGRILYEKFGFEAVGEPLFFGKQGQARVTRMLRKARTRLK